MRKKDLFVIPGERRGFLHVHMCSWGTLMWLGKAMKRLGGVEKEEKEQDEDTPPILRACSEGGR